MWFGMKQAQAAMLAKGIAASHCYPFPVPQEVVPGAGRAVDRSVKSNRSPREEL